MIKLILLLFLSCLNIAWSSELTQTTLPLEFNTGNPAPYGMASTVITIEGKTFPIIVDTGAKKYGFNERSIEKNACSIYR
jgi:hypothetical protein